jgi:hypothetical protein
VLTINDPVDLTETTTSYQINQDHVNLNETLDESYERHRSALSERQNEIQDSVSKSDEEVSSEEQKP